MSLKNRVYSILVVSAAEKLNSSLLEMLPESRFSPIKFTSSVSEAKRIVAEQAMDLIIINAPLPDDNGMRFAIDNSSGKNTVVLLLVRSDAYSNIMDEVTEHGVFVLAKPTSKPVMILALEWMEAARERIRAQETKTHTLEDKMTEIRIVNRAKLLLISEMQMDEAQAHRYIEKHAMDRCVTRRIVAEEIIKTYS